MANFDYFNPNPQKRNVGDCTLRSICKALNIPWESAYIDMSMEGYNLCDMPSSNAVFDSYLRSKGFRRYAIPNECPSCYTFADFADEYKQGTYIVCTGSHVATIKDSTLFDSWNSSQCIPQFFYERRT